MPEVARKSGTDSVSTKHGCQSITTTDQGSSDVFVNGIGAVRRGDRNRSHAAPIGPKGSCVPHTMVLTSYSGTVFVNGLNVGRKGDRYGNEEIISGSQNVFAG